MSGHSILRLAWSGLRAEAPARAELEGQLVIVTMTEDEALVEALAGFFQAEHFETEWFPSFTHLAKAIGSVPIDGMVIHSRSHVLEPLVSQVKTLRGALCNAAIILLTSQSDLSQRLRFFEVGVDDIIHKPFYAREIAARTSRILGLRKSATPRLQIEIGDITLDLVKRKAYRIGQDLKLRNKEFLLLEYLARNAGRPVTRTALLHQIWPGQSEAFERVVDVHLSSLRRKLRTKSPSPCSIQTIRGTGFVIMPPESQEHQLLNLT